MSYIPVTNTGDNLPPRLTADGRVVFTMKMSTVANLHVLRATLTSVVHRQEYYQPKYLFISILLVFAAFVQQGAKQHRNDMLSLNRTFANFI